MDSIEIMSNCNGADCAFGCTAGCIIVCLATGGAGLAPAALGGTLGGSGTAIAMTIE